MNDMELDYGAVRCFKEKGFGFIYSQFHGEDVFFHIKSVTDSDARYLLNEGVIWGGDVSIRLWYSVAETTKGFEAKSLRSNLNGFSKLSITTFTENVVIKCNTLGRLDADASKVVDELLLAGHLSQSHILDLLCNWKYLRDPRLYIKSLDTSNYKDAALAMKLLELWTPSLNPLPEWAIWVTTKLLGRSGLRKLQSERETAEQVRIDEARKQRERDEEMQEVRRQELKRLKEENDINAIKRLNEHRKKLAGTGINVTIDSLGRTLFYRWPGHWLSHVAVYNIIEERQGSVTSDDDDDVFAKPRLGTTDSGAMT